MTAGPFTARAERNCQRPSGKDSGFLFRKRERSKNTFAATRSGESSRAQLDSDCTAYCKAIMAMPAMQEWVEAANAEPDEVVELDVEF